MEACESTDNSIDETEMETVTDDKSLETETAPEPGDSEAKLFRSDDFKIEVQNLPRFFGIGQLKKLFNKKLKLNAHKIKPCGPGSTYLYVCFKNEEDKQHAIKTLDGYTLRDSKLRVKAAKYVDPYKKQQAMKQRENVVDERPVSVKLQDAVCPLARESYENQLLSKQKEVAALITKLGSEICKTCPTLKQWVGKKCDEFQGTLVPIENFVKSPQVTGYRNKCEFSIGYMSVEKESKTEDNVISKNPDEAQKEEADMSAVDTEDSKERTKIMEKIVSVGFRLASYKAGSVEVVSLSSLGEKVCELLPHLSPQMVNLVQRFEALVRVSNLLPYCSLTRTGNWRNLMVRSSRGPLRGEALQQQKGEGGELMLVVVLDPQNLSSEVVKQLTEDLITFFREGAGGDCGVSSLYLHLSPARREAGVPEPQPQLLFGPPTIQEHLMGCNFNISPQAFFQVNAQAAEVLYRTVGEIADLNKKTSLVDVCCGTGTIGLCLSDKVGQVVGVELIQEAVRDAIKNAESNKVSNCKFFAGKAEDILADILSNTVDSKQVVAVVDPPRAGLHPRALGAIRSSQYIKRLVYVSCDAKNAMKNFVDLSRPPSKTAKGDPFLPVKVIPVDLFPHTRGFELVILFERVPMKDILNSELSKRLADEEKESLNSLVSQADKIKEERERMEVMEQEKEESISRSASDFLDKL